MTTTMTTASIARGYVETVGAHDLDPLAVLFADDLVATFAGATYDKPAWVAALRRLLPALERNDVRRIFTDHDRACVDYDFVTNTEAGTVRCIELLTVDDGLVTEIELILDRVAFAPVNQALSERAARTP